MLNEMPMTRGFEKYSYVVAAIPWWRRGGRAAAAAAAAASCLGWHGRSIAPAKKT